MADRRTATFSVLVPVANAIQILPENTLRILYSIQNLDGANYVAVSKNSNVTAGAGASTDGQQVVAGGYLSDDVDHDEVYIIANTAAVRIVLQETSLHSTRKATSYERVPTDKRDNPHRQLRREAGRTRTARLAARGHG